MGMTQAEFAEEVGVAQGMISKWESGTDAPNLDNLISLSEATGEDFLLAQTGKPRGVQRSGIARPVAIVGAVQAGHWSEAVEWPHDDKYALLLPLPKAWKDIDFQGFLVRGSSMNRLYPEGSVVVAAPTIINQLDPFSGDKVVVQRQNESGLYEVTLKQLEITPDGIGWLWPRSTDPEHQTPLKFQGTIDLNRHDDRPDTVITGIVFACFKLERWLAL